MNVKKLLSAILTALLAMSPVVMALDLGDYPSFLFEDNNLDAYVVVGSAAAPADVVGAVDLAARLAGESYEEVGTGGDSVTVTGGESEDIPINKGMSATNYMDQVMDDEDLAGLLDSEVTFQSDSYNYREVLVFSSSQPSVHSSLTSSDDDYGEGVYLETSSGSIAYYWVFDEAINVSTATSSQPLRMEFLGKAIKITSVSSATTFTAYVGDTYSMNVGDSVEVEGKTVTLENVGSTGSVRLNIDGTLYTVSGTETHEGIEITIDDYFYADALAERGATIIMGKQASESYTDGDKYLKDDNICNNNPEDTDCWEWVVAGLTGNSATTVGSSGPSAGPYIGVKGVFTVNDDTDNPITAGGCYKFPNDYAEVCFDSLSVSEDAYMTLTLEYADSVDLSNAVGGKTAQNTMYLHTSEEEGLKLKSALSGLSADTRTTQVWLEVNTTDADWVNVYYRNSEGAKAYAGYVNTTASGGVNFAEIEYGDTKGTNMALDLAGDASGGADALNLTFDILGKTTTDLADNYDDLRVQLSHASSGAFDGLGATPSSEEANELQWCNGAGSGCVWKNIGTKDENHRSIYGIVIEDPKSHGASDEVVLRVPQEQVFAKIVVKGPSTTVTSSTSGTVKKVVPVTNAVAKLDTEVSLPVGKNLVLVGGPAVNRLTAQAMGLDYPTYGGSGLLPFSEGEGYIALYDSGLESGKYAVVVAGWAAGDTRNAASVLQQFGSFNSQLDGNVAVKVTSVSASGITAA
ncbi:MAG: S-layer protein [Candidatus Aenigmarchaeota archaeon]|nr:S-layer protein [Candidatus Aenigmarchaeota archaeon]